VSYTDKMIAEILASAQKIGVVKTSKLFNISPPTIYRWMNEKQIPPKENKIKTGSKKTDAIKLVLRRVHIQNDSFDFYVYNIKDLQTDLEFNSVSYNSNYKTPVYFLKYILGAFLKETKNYSFQITLKRSARINNFEKFNNLIHKCKIEFIKNDDRLSIDSFDHEQILEIKDKNKIIEFLTDEQLRYNIKTGKDNLKNFNIYLPVILDEFKPELLSENDDKPTLLSLERLIQKTDILLRNSDYNLAWEYIQTIKVIIEKSSDQKVMIQYYGLVIEYYSTQGDYNKTLEFLIYSHKKVDEKYAEVKFFLILKICIIHITNYNIKEFDYYFGKIDIVDFNMFSKDFILEFHLLMYKRKSLYLSIAESIDAYNEILDKHKKHISQKKLFDIYIKICTLYKTISNFSEAYKCLDKAYNLPQIQSDKYLLCEHHILKCNCLSEEGLFDEAFEYCIELEKLAKEHNFKDYYYECKAIKAFYYLDKGLFDKAKIEAEHFLNYGKATSNNFIIFKACIILQRYYSRTGDLTKALKYTKTQVKLSKLFFNIKYEAEAVINLCVIMSKLPVSKEMLHYVEELEELNKVLKDPGTKIKELTLKACYYQLKKENDSALEYYKKALQFAKKINSYNLISIICSHIAIINRDMKKFRAAVFSINESIYYYNINGTKYDLPRLTFIKAKIYFEANDLAKAQIYINEAKELAQIYNKKILNSCLELEGLIKQNL